MNASKRNSRKAFTLIELLVVILILAILAAMIVPRIVGRADDAKVAKAMADLSTLDSMLEQYRLDTGFYPTVEEGLQALREPIGDVDGWRGPYLTKSIPTDPWGGEYIYDWPGAYGDDSFYLYCLGADGAEGGEGNDADIYARE
jgi:general secretion pathway protein G